MESSYGIDRSGYFTSVAIILTATHCSQELKFKLVLQDFQLKCRAGSSIPAATHPQETYVNIYNYHLFSSLQTPGFVVGVFPYREAEEFIDHFMKGNGCKSR